MGRFDIQFPRWAWWTLAVFMPVLCAAQNKAGARVRLCKGSQLSATMSPDVISDSAGHRAMTIVVRNHSSRSCVVAGVPAVAFADRANKALPVHVCSNCPDSLFTDQPVQDVLLKRNQSAYVVVGYVDIDGNEGCKQAARLNLQIGKEWSTLKVRVEGMRTCGVADLTPFLANPLPTPGPAKTQE